MYTRIQKIPNNKSFFLFGPRGTGKTTWLKAKFPDALYLDLLKAEVYNDLLARPGLLAELIPDPKPDLVIVDEVQRVPELLNEVHRLIEERRIVFALTGSSTRKLKRGDADMLAGRALTLYLYPLTVEELGSDFSLG
jgi:predicted AAA+ superfamily ATPase